MVARTASKKILPRIARQDGSDTRAQLLDTAGALFAEAGYAATSSKDICKAAKVNHSAVNYYFGSREGLYGEVLVEAHRQLVDLDALAEFAKAGNAPRATLKTVLAHFVQQAALGQKSWAFRVLLREVTMPSALSSHLVDQAIKPKALVLKGLVAAVLKLPADHPAVQRGVMLTLLPCIGLLLAPRDVFKTVMPALRPDAPDLVADITRYAFAGLDALARAYRDKATPRR